MTNQEARARGADRGSGRAELVCLDTPWDGIAERLEKWSKRGKWVESFNDDKRFHGFMPDNATPANWKAAEAGYIEAGLKFVKGYIKELKDDGLLQEKRR